MKYYATLSTSWSPFPSFTKENFFVSYALNGPMIVPSEGIQGGIPVDHPIDAPTIEPSLLNTRCKYAAHGFKPTC